MNKKTSADPQFHGGVILRKLGGDDHHSQGYQHSFFRHDRHFDSTGKTKQKEEKYKPHIIKDGPVGRAPFLHPTSQLGVNTATGGMNTKISISPGQQYILISLKTAY
jgi:hypothetical protein